MLLESGGRRVEVHGKALSGPENARLMRKAGEKRTKNEGQRGGKTRREKKKKQRRTWVSPNPRHSATRQG